MSRKTACKKIRVETHVICQLEYILIDLERVGKSRKQSLEKLGSLRPGAMLPESC